MAVPIAADIGRRLLVHWAKDKKWFSGKLANIEPGHDDGSDVGDFHVLYDDGDEHWEPLGSRMSYKWVSESLPTLTLSPSSTSFHLHAHSTSIPILIPTCIPTCIPIPIS
jgi:hypothetical protein